MTLQELGIDEATWTQALTNADLWKPGQRCEDERVWGTTSCIGGHEWVENHEIPMPEPTDTLLMAMLREGLKREPAFLIQIDYRLDGVDPLLNQATLDAAIIRATASLGKQHRRSPTSAADAVVVIVLGLGILVFLWKLTGVCT